MNVYVGFCVHNHLQAATVARYASEDDLLDMRARFRVELVAGPVTMGGECMECKRAKPEAA